MAKAGKKGKAFKQGEKRVMSTKLKQRRWGFLRQWCESVNERLDLVVDWDASPPSVGLLVLLDLQRDMQPGALASLRQTLMLLSALAGVDREGFKYVLENFCALELRDEEEYAVDESVEPVFIGVVVVAPEERKYDVTVQTASCLPAVGAGDLSMCTSDRARLAVLVKNFFLRADEPMSSEFTEVARKIVDCADCSVSAVSKVYVPAQVVVDPGDFFDATTFTELIALTVQDVQALGNGFCFPLSRDYGDGTLDWTLELTHVRFQTQVHALTPVVMAPFQELVPDSSGLSISELPLSYKAAPGYFKDAFKLTADRAFFFERILCANRNSVGEADAATINSLTISNLSLSHMAIQRLFTAFAEARTTRSLTLAHNLAPGDTELQTRLWEGIAYAFFSKHAHSSIENLTIDGNLVSVDSAERVAEVLRDDSPSSFLTAGSADSGVEGGNVKNFQSAFEEGRYMLREGTELCFAELDEFDGSREYVYANDALIELYEIEKKNEEGERVWELDTDVVGVRIVGKGEKGQNSKPYLKVLVPAYGMCWVPSGCVEELENEETSATQSPSTIKTLTLSFKQVQTPAQTLNGLTHLLRSVGGQLSRLNLTIPIIEAPLDLTQLLDSCPNLTSFRLKRVPVDAQVLVEYCNTKQRWFSELDCVFENIEALLDELQRTNSPFARNLKRLTTVTTGLESEEDHLKALAKMLKRNRVLQRLSITISSDYKYFQSNGFNKYHGDYLPVAKQPLPLTSRLAFLSVFRSKRDAEQSNVKRGKYGTEWPKPLPLDPDVLAIIFAFAADPMRRCVTTKLSYFGWLHEF